MIEGADDDPPRLLPPSTPNARLGRAGRPGRAFANPGRASFGPETPPSTHLAVAEVVPAVREHRRRWRRASVDRAWEDWDVQARRRAGPWARLWSRGRGRRPLPTPAPPRRGEVLLSWPKENLLPPRLRGRGGVGGVRGVAAIEPAPLAPPPPPPPPGFPLLQFLGGRLAAVQPVLGRKGSAWGPLSVLPSFLDHQMDDLIEPAADQDLSRPPSFSCSIEGRGELRRCVVTMIASKRILVGPAFVAVATDARVWMFV